MKQTYHTNIKIAYNLGILPVDLKNKIPSSTRHNWKSVSFSDYFGLDYSLEIDQKIDTCKNVLQYDTLYKTVVALTCIYKVFVEILAGMQSKIQILNTFKESIIQAVETSAPLIGKEKSLKAFGLSPQLFNYWKRKVECVASPIQLCRKVYYNQLTVGEVGSIKGYLSNESFIAWPLSSVYYKMIKDKAAIISLSTFYHYTRLLKLGRMEYFKKKQYARIGIRAELPFSILHMDITEYETTDRGKVYISFIVDNFSRSILGYMMDIRKTAELSVQNLRRVITKFYQKGDEEFDMIVDGGSENKGLFEVFIKDAKQQINKKVALLDISSSNSVVEAVNKIFKKYYLRYRLLPHDEVRKELDFFVDDYTYHRPHGSLLGLTPNEKLIGIAPESELPTTSEVKNAVKRRIETNLNENCDKCLI